MNITSFDNNNLSEILCSLDKIETIAKVLNQTLIEGYDFDTNDSQNLCSVLLREISYTKTKISKLGEKQNSQKIL